MYARALKTLRQFHRLSQVELSEKIDLSRSYINELERNRKEPSIDVLKKYAEAFDMPLSSVILFAERSSEERGAVSKTYVIDKVLRLLEWVAEGDDYEQKDRKLKPLADTR